MDGLDRITSGHRPWCAADCFGIKAHGADPPSRQRRLPKAACDIAVVPHTPPFPLRVAPVTGLREQGTLSETKSAVIRLVHHMKGQSKTVLFTELLPDDAGEYSRMNVSSIVDTWIRRRMIKSNGELARLIHIAKTRGINASNQVRGFHIRPKGLCIETPCVGPGEMVVGTARKMREREETRQRRRAERHLENLQHQLSIRERMAAVEEGVRNRDLQIARQEIEALEEKLANQLDSRDRTRKERRVDPDPGESQA